MSQTNIKRVPAPRLLVVEDDELGRKAMERYFRREFAVHVAKDGREGLEMALESRFDVILSDMDMPRMGGREMYERLVAAFPEYRERTVFMTGGPHRIDDLRWLEDGREWMRKPMDFSEVVRTLWARAMPPE